MRERESPHARERVQACEQASKQERESVCVCERERDKARESMYLQIYAGTRLIFADFSQYVVCLLVCFGDK